jgi:hypothetical protein
MGNEFAEAKFLSVDLMFCSYFWLLLHWLITPDLQSTWALGMGTMMSMQRRQ